MVGDLFVILGWFVLKCLELISEGFFWCDGVFSDVIDIVKLECFLLVDVMLVNLSEELMVVLGLKWRRVYWGVVLLEVIFDCYFCIG